MKPSQLLRLVNSTPLGTVLTDVRLRKHRQTAGDRIGDGRTVDFVRYAGWLAAARVRSQPPADASTADPRKTDAYTRKKESERIRQAKLSREGRELGELPPPKDPRRREACRGNLQLFLETYFAEDFPRAWSDDHLTFIESIQKRAHNGGLKAIGMPRGTGKTSIVERAIVYCALYGLQPYLVIIGANKEAATENLETIKTILETSELLAEDFPEVCVPVREIEGRNNRCNGQHYRGQRTRIRWDKTKIILPTIEGSLASGVVIQVSGILGRVRGMKHKTTEGVSRPSFVLIDDPQTDNTVSDAQIKKRMKVMTGAILGLAGPGVNIAGVAAVTVIKVGDLADQILDRDAHPEWDGLRTKMLYGEAKNRDLLDAYWDRRAEEMRVSGGDVLVETNRWYLANQAKIEEGLTAAWPARKNDDEVSAIQHALNLIQDRGKDIFDAEYQNEPQSETAGDEWHISATDIAAKVSGLPRSVAPLWTNKVTAFVDVQQRLLYWIVVAWGEGGRGSIIDYGSWPEQKSREFTYREARHTLARMYPKRGVKGAIVAGLGDLTKHLLERDWRKEDKTLVRISAMGIDSGNWTNEVHEFVRTNPHAAILMPTKGKGIAADKSPISEWRKKPSEQIGEEWILSPQPKHASRLLTYDTNYWKRALFLGLATPAGDPGDLSLFGSETVLTHRMIASHFHAESFEKVEGQGRSVCVFSEKPGRPDNHLFDCAVGALVMRLPGLPPRRVRPKKIQATYLNL